MPLIFVDGARQEALDIGVFGRNATTDHLGNRAGDHDARLLGVQRLMRAPQSTLGTALSEFFLGQAGNNDRQFMRGERVGVVQYRGHGQVFATHRTINNDLQALDRREHIHGTPVSASAIVVED